MQSKKDTIKEILAHKVSSMTIGMIVVALFGIPLLQNIAITVILTTLTLIKDYFLRRHFYKKALKRFEDDLTNSLKGLDEVLNATDPYVAGVTITEESVDKEDENRQIPKSSTVTDKDLELQHIMPNNLEEGQTIIMQLLDTYPSASEVYPSVDEDDLTYVWKQSGKSGLNLVKTEDIESDEDD